MSEADPSAELLPVDPDLVRRVAWGLLAGRTKADIAAAEGIEPALCQEICESHGMLARMNVWVCFLERRREAGVKNLRKLAGWAIEHIFTQAPERLHKDELWRLDRLGSIVVDYGFAFVFRWFLAHLDGVMGVVGVRRRELGPFRQNLVDLVAWAIEETLLDKMGEQFPAELLIARDRAFAAAIAEREVSEIIRADGKPAAEQPAETHTEPEAAAAEPSDHPVSRSEVTVPARKARPSRRPRPAPAVAPALPAAHASPTMPLPYRAGPRPSRRRAEPWPLRRASARPPPLHDPGRLCRPPPLVRTRPIECAAPIPGSLLHS